MGCEIPFHCYCWKYDFDKVQCHTIRLTWVSCSCRTQIALTNNATSRHYFTTSIPYVISCICHKNMYISILFQIFLCNSILNVWRKFIYWLIFTNHEITYVPKKLLFMILFMLSWGIDTKCPANDQLDNYTNYQTMTCLSLYEKNVHFQS